MTDMSKDYGLGLTKIPFYERYSYGKGGAIDAFIASISFFPEENLAFSGILNGGAFSLNDLLTGVKSIWFDREYHFPEFTSGIEVSREELEQYPGNYSSISSSDKLTIVLKENQLYGQATGGGPSFPLEPFEKNKFRVEVAGLEFEFFPTENKLIVKQRGSILFEMTKE